MKKYLVIFRKQEGETKSAYSVVDEQTLKFIPTQIIQKKTEVADRLYSNEELEKLRDKFSI